jgi:hypothetical protein
MSLKSFLLLLALIESGGDPNVIGDGGEAVGVLQMHSVAVSEANRILGYPAFNAKDRLSPAASFEMARIILTHWRPILEERHGVKWTSADSLSLWRWGPSKWSPKAKENSLDRRRSRDYDLLKARLEVGTLAMPPWWSTIK